MSGRVLLPAAPDVRPGPVWATGEGLAGWCEQRVGEEAVIRLHEWLGRRHLRGHAVAVVWNESRQRNETQFVLAEQDERWWPFWRDRVLRPALHLWRLR